MSGFNVSGDNGRLCDKTHLHKHKGSQRNYKASGEILLIAEMEPPDLIPPESVTEKLIALIVQMSDPLKMSQKLITLQTVLYVVSLIGWGGKATQDCKDIMEFLGEGPKLGKGKI